MNDDFEDDVHVDLTSLIDVIFMLVIFFVMTMSFTMPVIDIQLPNSTTSEPLNKDKVVSITAKADGNYIINNQEANLQEVQAYVQGLDNVTLELSIDKNAPAQMLIDIADLSRKYQQGKLIILTNKTVGDK